jgi:hypothetical protein
MAVSVMAWRRSFRRNWESALTAPRHRRSATAAAGGAVGAAGLTVAFPSRPRRAAAAGGALLLTAGTAGGLEGGEACHAAALALREAAAWVAGAGMHRAGAGMQRAGAAGLALGGRTPAILGADRGSRELACPVAAQFAHIAARGAAWLFDDRAGGARIPASRGSIPFESRRRRHGRPFHPPRDWPPRHCVSTAAAGHSSSVVRATGSLAGWRQ